VIDVGCNYHSTLNCTLPAPRFLGKPVPSDRLKIGDLRHERQSGSALRVA
jgi:hypothetical protein